MINVKFNSDSFLKEMNNIAQYSIGFVDGAKKGKTELLQNIGKVTVEALKQFIDSNARGNPDMLHHVYEWYQTGSPDARLFDIQYSSNQMGLSFSSTFTQSQSIKRGSNVPFYNKAEIMENGIPVTIVPKKRGVLAFENQGEQVFTKSPVFVDKPGGESVAGGYEKIFKQFFDQYFSQSFLKASGLLDHLQNPTPFKKNFAQAKSGGKSLGISVGYRWVSKPRGGLA